MSTSDDWAGFSAVPVEPWSAPGCRCNGKREWVSSADPAVWVHWVCGQPSPATLEGESVRVDIHIMQHGPHHNELVETHDLCQNREYAWISDYKWTNQVIVGSESGRKARVWVHKDHYDPSMSTV